MRLIAIFGPTACGKTDLAAGLFAANSSSPLAGSAEIISADSVQIYQHLDIGSAKPSLALRRILPHHCVDFLPPHEDFSVARFVEMADEAAKSAASRGKIPVLIGGTAFYVKHFFFGLPTTPSADLKIRSRLRNEMNERGRDEMHRRLQSADPVSAAKIHPNDEYRVLRALEVIETSGRPLSDFSLQKSPRREYDFLRIRLTLPREKLCRRIEMRSEKMFESGLADEVKHLVEGGCTAKTPAMKSIGYREFFDENGDFRCDDIEKICESIKADTKRLAKMQETFFKSIGSDATFDAEDADGVEKFLTERIGC